MELNEQSVNAHFLLMTKPQDYKLPIRPLEKCFEPSEEVTAQHILYAGYRKENPNCAKVFFYIVMWKIYGEPYLKDKKGNLGFPLKFKEKNAV